MSYVVHQRSKTPWNLEMTDARGNALNVPTMNDHVYEQDPESEDSALDEEGDECAAAESEEEIVETIPPSQMKTLRNCVLFAHYFCCCSYIFYHFLLYLSGSLAISSVILTHSICMYICTYNCIYGVI